MTDNAPSMPSRRAETGPLDPSVMESLKELERAGASGLAGKMARLFLDDAAKRLDALSRAAASGNAGEMWPIAHGLKSASANVGALALSKLFRDLESMGRAGSTEGSGALLESIMEEFAAVRSALLEIALA